MQIICIYLRIAVCWGLRMKSRTMTSEIRALYKTISEQTSYKPTPLTNRLFRRLVALALSGDAALQTLTPKEIANLQRISSLAEYELEMHWAKRIASSDTPDATLQTFPYYSNYEKLTKLEWFALRSCQNHTEHAVLFVGGGPLPLTAILLATSYGQAVAILDYDSAACQAAQSVIAKLGLSHRVSVIDSDAATFDGYSRFNTIFVAALAGAAPQEKEKIMQRIKELSPRHAHILARSSWGTREILYTPLDQKLFSVFQPIIEVRPHHDVVNSVVIFENSKQL